MPQTCKEYDLLFRFIETYTPSGFQGIDLNDPLILQLEEMMEDNDQFFYISDIIQMKVLFTSRRSKEMIGIEPEDVTPYHFMEAAHNDDIQRLNLGRGKIIKMAQDLFIAKKGYGLLSTNYRFRNPSGAYSDILVQAYIYYTVIPYRTVFFLKVHTNIDWHRKIKHGYHYYVGTDLSWFRYPDDNMLMKGNVFSDREFEIIRLIESGLNTDEIGNKLFISPHTVNTHRRNMLEKSGKESVAELIYELKERGVL
jgi:DNA-binding CsgD family transcriptional regulator